MQSLAPLMKRNVFVSFLVVEFVGDKKLGDDLVSAVFFFVFFSGDFHDFISRCS